MTDLLIQFLRARYNEDAARQQSPFEQWHNLDCEAVPDSLHPDVETGSCTCGVPQRVLAETEAKREILLAFEAAATDAVRSAVGVDTQDGLISGLTEAVKQLASVYDSHPDYREEWKP